MKKSVPCSVVYPADVCQQGSETLLGFLLECRYILPNGDKDVLQNQTLGQNFIMRITTSKRLAHVLAKSSLNLTRFYCFNFLCMKTKNGNSQKKTHTTTKLLNGPQAGKV